MWPFCVARTSTAAPGAADRDVRPAGVAVMFAVLWVTEFGLLFQVYVFGFMISAGTLGAACFPGAVIAAGVD
jgi:hypothetical protein